MTPTRCLAFVLSAVVISFASGVAYSNHAAREGALPYTPTRLEWLAVELNARAGFYLHHQTGFLVEFNADHDINGISIVVNHAATDSRDSVNEAVATSRAVVKLLADSHGWKWVGTREEARLTK